MSKKYHVLLLSIFVFGFGLVGYLLFQRGTATSYIFAHLGALGILAILGWVVGYIAVQKRRKFYTAFLLATLVPIFFGGIAVLFNSDSVTCGGSICLATSVAILIVIPFLKKNKTVRIG